MNNDLDDVFFMGLTKREIIELATVVKMLNTTPHNLRMAIEALWPGMPMS